jgi:single-strand DNA-binding protein
MNVNKVLIVGRVTNDPEIRTIPSGQNVASFGVATNRFWTDRSGQKQKSTEFHNIVAWSRLAEIVQKFLTKGSLVFIEGRLQTRNWQDQQGNKRYRTEVVTERLQLGPRASGQTAVPETETTETTEEPTTTEETASPEEEINPDEIPF